MYPSRFDYEAPRTVAEAIELLGRGNGEAKVIAGGQSLVPMMKLRFANPAMLVDINNIPGLDYIRTDPDGTLRIGALVRHGDMERSTLIASTQPTLAAAAPLVADPIVRSRGTFVGSVCHADPQGDWAATLLALGGAIVAEGPSGRRTIPVSSFVTGPFQNVLAYDELAIEAVVPAPRGVRAGGYLKLERRVGDFATASVAVALELSGANVLRCGIALAAVGGSTIDAAEATAELVGGPLTSDRIARAAERAAAAAQPRSDHRGSATYKRHVVHTFVTRILENIVQSHKEAA
ncbi:MAG: FAD binding domain-containing protein [Ilumatobacteraceae bacterium]